MRNFYTDFLCRSPLFRSPERVSRLDHLEPTFRNKIRRLIDAAKAEGIDARVIETYRSRERQRELYRQGKSQLRGVGVHHFGLAADLVRVVADRAVWDGDWSWLERLAKADGLVWGGNWKGFPDPGHLQAVRLQDQARLFAGTWYPAS